MRRHAHPVSSRPVQLARTRKHLLATTGNRRLVCLLLRAWDRLPPAIRCTLLHYWLDTAWPPVVVLMPKVLDAVGTEAWAMVREDGCVVLISKALLSHGDDVALWGVLHELAHCYQYATHVEPDERAADALASRWLGHTPASFVGRHDVQAVAALAPEWSGPQWTNYP